MLFIELHPSSSRRLLRGAGAAVLALCSVSSGAQTAAAPASAAAPQAPLRLIVPFTPGTGIDIVARTLGPRLGERLGRPVVVDNRPGASTPDELRKLVEHDAERWAQLIKTQAIRAQ